MNFEDLINEENNRLKQRISELESQLAEAEDNERVQRIKKRRYKKKYIRTKYKYYSTLF